MQVFHDRDLQADTNSQGDLLANLRRTVQDCAIQHYLSRARRVKKWEKALERGYGVRTRVSVSIKNVCTCRRGGPSWTPLVARYSFKIAWFYEFQGNLDKALRHYRAAYASLSALSVVLLAAEPAMIMALFSKEFQDPNDQVKGVADYVNYKVCRLALQHNKVEEAATHIQTHLWHFRQTSAGDATHQHWGWLSRQHVVFAQLITHYSTLSHSNGTCVASEHIPCIFEKPRESARADVPSISERCALNEPIKSALRLSMPTSSAKLSCSVPMTQSQIKFTNSGSFLWLRDRRDFLAYAEPLYHYAAAAACAVARCV